MVAIVITVIDRQKWLKCDQASFYPAIAYYFLQEAVEEFPLHNLFIFSSVAHRGRE